MTTRRWLPSMLMVLVTATGTGCGAFRDLGRAAASNPAALIGGVAATALLVGGAQRAFELDPHAAREAERRYPSALQRVEANPSYFPPP